MAWTFEATREGYLNMWRSAFVKQSDSMNAETFANKIIAAESQYRQVQAATGVPWYFVGALHMRESSCNFDGVLHNGEKIIGTGKQTSLVPSGRGPFLTWAESAIDALKLKDLHRVQEWSVERMLYSAEVFNGLGYVGKGVNSPYVWAGTTHEQPGKYVRDHVFDASAEDSQLGVAAVLKRLAEKRSDIAAELRSDGLVTPLPPEVLPPGAQINDAIPVLLSIVAAVLQARQPGTGQDAITQILEQLTKGVQPPVIEQPKPEPKPEPKPDTPTTRPSVQLGVAGLFGSIIAQVLGIVGTPFGMGVEPTTAGTLSTLIPMAVGAVGLTGGWGALASIGLRLVGSLASSIASRARP